MATPRSLVILENSLACPVFHQTAALSFNSRRSVCVRAEANSKPGYDKQSPGTITGIVLERGQIFNPSEEASLQLVPPDNRVSLARQLFTPSTEEALNDAINVAYSMSYVFHSMWTFFDRDNVGLPGHAEYFKHRSEHERDEAQSLMEYQNLRGGAVRFKPLVSPHNEYFHADKGEGLHAMEIALSMEKVQNEKYQALHKAAEAVEDPDMCDYVVKNYVRPQSVKLNRSAKYVSQLRRVGRGYGEYHFDTALQNGDFEEEVLDPNAEV